MTGIPETNQFPHCFHDPPSSLLLLPTCTGVLQLVTEGYEFALYLPTSRWHTH